MYSLIYIYPSWLKNKHDGQENGKLILRPVWEDESRSCFYHGVYGQFRSDLRLVINFPLVAELITREKNQSNIVMQANVELFVFYAYWNIRKCMEHCKYKWLKSNWFQTGKFRGGKEQLCLILVILRS